MGEESTNKRDQRASFAVENELSLTTCSKCHTNKWRRKIMRKKVEHIDEKGELWNGKACPECTKAKAREHMTKIREAKRELKAAIEADKKSRQS